VENRAYSGTNCTTYSYKIKQSKQLPDNCITKQNVKEQIYSNLIFMPYGTKIGASLVLLRIGVVLK